MNILYIIDGKLTVTNWSGTTKAIYDHMSQLANVDLLETDIGFFNRLICKCKDKIAGKYTFSDRTRRCISSRSRIISRKIKEGKYDAVFCIGSLVAASIPKGIGIPIYIYVDSVMSVMRNYYWTIDDKTYKIANDAESSALNNSVESKGKIFVSSDWCRNACINDYGIPSGYVETVRIGANNILPFDSSKTAEAMNSSAANLENGKVNLFFVGYDYKRKGLDEVFELMRVLMKRGIKVNLNMVGNSAPIPDDLVSYVKPYGILRKDIPSELDALRSLYLTSDFFVFPTHAECVGAVICEASEFGLPVLTTETGGVPSLVENGVNGFSSDFNADLWADTIQKYIKNSSEYLKLRQTTLDFYQENLNWDKICRKMLNSMESAT